MSTTVLIFVLWISIISTTLSNHILRVNDAHNTCIEQIFNETIENEKFITISWSERFHNTIKDEILKILMRKIDLTIMSCSFGSSNWHMYRKTTNDPVLIFASNETGITSGISSVLKENVWSFNSKFIVVYMEGSGNERKSSTDLLMKDILKMFAKLNALDIQIFYINDKGFEGFTWFPYDDSNCETINIVRLISGCKLGFYQSYLKSLNTAKLESNCSITVASMESNTSKSNTSELMTGIEVSLVKELGKWLKFELNLTCIDRNFDGVQLKEKYVAYERSQFIDFSFILAT